MPVDDRLVPVVLSILIATLAIPRLLESPPPIGPDAFVFEYGGWLLANGHPPYTTIWDVKPPAVYYLTAGLFFISGGDPVLSHWLAIVVNAGSVVLASIFVSRIVRNLTDDNDAALAAGITLIAYPTVYVLPATGFRPKFVVLALTMGSLWLYSEGDRLKSVAIALLAPAFWQASVVVPLILGIFSIRDDRSNFVPLLVIGSVITAAIVLPIAILTGLKPLIQQTVLAPLLFGDATKPIQHILRGSLYLGFAAPLALLGGAELILRLWGRDHLWLILPALFFAIYATLFDLDGPPDLLLPFAFVTIGVGLFVASQTQRLKNIVVIGAVIFVGLNLLVFAASLQPSVSHIPTPAGVGPTSHIDTELLWDMQLPESCHIRLSELERQWIAERGRTDCGS